MSSPYEDDTFTEVSESKTGSSLEGESREAADLDLDHDNSPSGTYTSESHEDWSEGVSQSPNRTSPISDRDQHLQVYSVSSIGESSSRSSLSSSGRIVQKWSQSSTSAGTNLSQDISTELPEDPATGRDASYSEDFTTTSATSVTEEDVRSDRSSVESASVKEELTEESTGHHGDSYHGYSSDDFESAGSQSSAPESVSAEKESAALSNFLLRACQVVKQNSSATLDREVQDSSSTLQVAGKPDGEDTKVTPELLEFCSRKLKLLRDGPKPGDEIKSTKGKIPRSHKVTSSSDFKARRRLRKEPRTVEESKAKASKKYKRKFHDVKQKTAPAVFKAVVEIAPPQEDMHSSIDWMQEVHKKSSKDRRKYWLDVDSTKAQGLEGTVPQGLVDRLRLDNIMLDVRKGAKVKVHNPSTCRSCVKQQGALQQAEFLRKSRVAVERKMIDAKVEQHLATHDSLTLIGQIAGSLPRPTDDPQVVWSRLMKETGSKKDGENNRGKFTPMNNISSSINIA